MPPAQPAFRYDNMLAILEATVRAHGDRPAFGVRRDDAQWHWTTWAEFGARVDALRAALAAKGVQRGDRVAIISNNRLEWLIGCYAAFGLAATWVPMYEAMLDKDWAYILDDSGASLCFVANDDIDGRLAAVRPDLPRIGLGADFEALSAAGARSPVPVSAPSGDDIAYFIYTSGTTGKPKGVRLTHRNLASQAQALQLAFPLSPDDRTLAFLPWAHVGGAGSELGMLILHGASTAICEKTEWILESLPVVQPTVLLAVPRIWNRIYDGLHKQMAAQPRAIQALFAAGVRAAQKAAAGEPLGLGERIVLPLARRLIFAKVVARFGGRLKYACSGAAALSPDVGRFVNALGIEVYEGYGMTESSSLATVNPQGAARIGSVGTALPGVDIRLDRPAGADEGEVLIYGHGVMAGYHNLPEETARTLTADGGVRSGDLGRLDADGYLYITGRVKEIYKLENGKYVSPAPLEERLTLSPLIAQAMVYGDNRPFNVAILVPDLATLRERARAHGIDGDDAAALCADPRVRALYRQELDRLAADKGYERVQDFVLVPEEFTVANEMLTPTLKLKRRAVLERHGAAVDALYTAVAR